ncbi:MAG: hypothetical protein H6841_01955 [Planctomycetes bacterium]|nr:hypothetical protein [Planctomycetota bacterium]MCB9935176.1 hypothetical protein [Planctomycetota bacterium]
MAKKPLPPKRAAGGQPKGPSGAPSAVQSEAVGKFDKFATFALAVPSAVLAIACLVIGLLYTNEQFDVGIFGFPKKSIMNWNAGSDSVQKLTPVQITGFETHNYVGHLSEGELDVAVLNAGSDNNVNLGDVFTLAGQTDADVRLEFVVFDVGDNISRAYVLLGQDVSEGKSRKYSLRQSDLERLCGGLKGIDVKRDWNDQIVRRYCEARSNAQ